MRLSIIILSWNTRDLLARCLASIDAYPPAGDFEVIVIDNASADGSAALVRERFPAARLIVNETNVGFARGNNQGLRAAHGALALLLNSDTRVTPGALEEMTTFLENNPRAAVVAPKLLNPDGSFQASYAGFPTYWSEVALMTGLARHTIGPHAPSPDPVPGEGPRRVDWVAGAALMVRQAVVTSVGGLDESFFFYSEETDWCRRMHAAGYEVWYLPDAEVIHVGGASAQLCSLESYLRLYKGKVHYFRRAYGISAARRLAATIKVVAAARIAVRSVTTPFRAREAQLQDRTKLGYDVALLRASLASPGKV